MSKQKQRPLVTEFELDLGDLGYQETSIYGDIERLKDLGDGKARIRVDMTKLVVTHKELEAEIPLGILSSESIVAIETLVEEHLEDMENGRK